MKKGLGVCPITRSSFLEQAIPIVVKLGSQEVEIEPYEFSTGSFGWFTNQRGYMQVGDTRLPVTIQSQIIVVHSKDAED